MKKALMKVILVMLAGALFLGCSEEKDVSKDGTIDTDQPNPTCDMNCAGVCDGAYFQCAALQVFSSRCWLRSGQVCEIDPETCAKTCLGECGWWNAATNQCQDTDPNP